MALSNLLKTLEDSKTYKDFKKSEEGKSAFLCAAFIIINAKQNSTENSLDFRNDKNIFTFKILDNEVLMQKEELIQSQKPLEKIDDKQIASIKADAEDIQKLVEKELEKNKITNPIEEIIAVFQSNQEEKSLIWSLTCICAGFTIVSMKIDALSGGVLRFDKKNLLDFVSVKKPEKK